TVVTNIRSPTIRGVECGPGPASIFIPDMCGASIAVSQTVLPFAGLIAITTSCEPLRYIVYSAPLDITIDEYPSPRSRAHSCLGPEAGQPGPFTPVASWKSRFGPPHWNQSAAAK